MAQPVPPPPEKPCPVFVMQLAVSVVGMGLSVARLIMGGEAAVYLPVVTSIVGYWLPAPRRPPPPPLLPPPPPVVGGAESEASVATRGRHRRLLENEEEFFDPVQYDTAADDEHPDGASAAADDRDPQRGRSPADQSATSRVSGGDGQAGQV